MPAGVVRRSAPEGVEIAAGECVTGVRDDVDRLVHEMIEARQQRIGKEARMARLREDAAQLFVRERVPALPFERFYPLRPS